MKRGKRKQIMIVMQKGVDKGGSWPKRWRRINSENVSALRMAERNAVLYYEAKFSYCKLGIFSRYPQLQSQRLLRFSYISW